MCWCCYLYFTTFGEKIYINQAIKPSKINGLRRLSNAYMTYNKEKETYIETGVCKALNDMIFEIKYLQRYIQEMGIKDREQILILLEKYKNNSELTPFFPYVGLASFAVIYERKFNILQLTKYIFKCFNERTDSIEYPLLLHGLINNGRPTEEELLSIFEPNFNSKG